MGVCVNFAEGSVFRGEKEISTFSAGIADWENSDISFQWFASRDEAQAWLDRKAQEYRNLNWIVQTRPGEVLATSQAV